MKRSRGAFAFEGSFPVHAPTSTLSVNEEEEEEKRLFERRTVVFGSKIGVGKGTEPWYKYTPDALRNAVVSISGLDSDFILGSSSHSEREPPAKRIRTDDTATSTSASPTSTSPTSTKNHSHSAIVLEWDDKSDPRCGVLCILRTERKPETTASAALNPTSTAAAATTATKMESNTCTGTNEALLPETEQPDQIKLIGQATNHPYSCPYVLFITEQSRVKECLEYRFPESSTPKIKLSASDAAEGDVEMEVDTIDTAKLSSSSFLIPRASALSTSCLSKGADGWDWVIPSDSDSNSTSDCKPCCVYTKAEDVWILGLEAIRFVDGGMKVVGVGTNGMDETGGMRTVPVTRWKFVSNS
ncbi:hypothetical protein BDP27DRAFT_390413 [Rhodocollybia butyracea]|uniref:Uncharacterized protein n=1 Tax=Rhodocollybia butyracea TaxID=206335 RepID=A0A9P5PUT7_9AGAR|nr:hypothetical protein BDP27DRAFT_390413 [Rhodocollybia butyracea]